MEGIISIRKKDETKVIRGINILRLSIKITNREEIPGQIPYNEPDLNLTLQSEILEEIFRLGVFVAKETDTLTF